jgi:hypothetical protein
VADNHTPDSKFVAGTLRLLVKKWSCDVACAILFEKIVVSIGRMGEEESTYPKEEYSVCHDLLGMSGLSTSVLIESQSLVCCLKLTTLAVVKDKIMTKAAL